MAYRKFIIATLAATLVLFTITGCDLFDEDTEGTSEVGDECNGTVDCTPGSICWNDICIEGGVLRFSLLWTDETDLDLHVITPNGTEIYFGNTTADYGELDVDDCVGDCAIPGGNHVENVFFVEGASSGTYTYWVVNYDGEYDSSFTLEVAEGDSVVDTHSGTVSSESDHYTHSF